MLYAYFALRIQMDKQLLHSQLDKIEHLAHSSKIQRLVHNPWNYVSSIFFRDVIYPKTKKGKVVTTDTFFGKSMEIVLPAGMDIYITKGKSHDSEIRLARLMMNELNVGDTFIDIGAHFGYFSLLGSVLVGNTGKVFSFEASEGTYEVLKKNCNAESQVKLHHNAVSDTQGVLEFFEFPILYSEFNTLEIEQFEKSEWIKKYSPKKIQVKSVVMDELITRENINPKLIKIDVEGAEYKVINGMKESLKKLSPMVVLEFLSKSRGNEGHVKAAELLGSLGYKSYSIGKDGGLVLCGDPERYLEVSGSDSDNIVFKK